MEKLTQPGECCPNPACPMHGKAQMSQSKPPIIKAGKTCKGVQRFFCQVCGKYFVATSGTIFLS